MKFYLPLTLLLASLAIAGPLAAEGDDALAVDVEPAQDRDCRNRERGAIVAIVGAGTDAGGSTASGTKILSS
ncbi:hypothetical protein FE257_002557 [Aspergillus nanangensis]|uniref:Uncharacterized protein n=1 Tax=Aspergillus nanangensis TaxID=2582783 RepID=A0AAD4GWS7_ASPNN|nr:hypothetical protein FE257_002557 [Aspergillus nanangensis]